MHDEINPDLLHSLSPSDLLSPPSTPFSQSALVYPYDLNSALTRAFLAKLPELLTDIPELLARLARRRGRDLQRPLRAFCLAIRATDTRIEHPITITRSRLIHEADALGRRGQSAIRRPDPGYATRPYTITTAVLQRLCGPIVLPGRIRVDQAAAILGVSPRTVMNAIGRKLLRVEYVRGLGGRFGKAVPVVSPLPAPVDCQHASMPIDPAYLTLGKTRDPAYGPLWERHIHHLPADFEQTVMRTFTLNSDNNGRGWAFLCPGCSMPQRSLFLPMPLHTLPRALCAEPTDRGSFLQNPDAGLRALFEAAYVHVSPELDGPPELPFTLACADCHRLHQARTAVDDGESWNRMVTHLTAGLLYGREVPRPKPETPEHRLATEGQGTALVKTPHKRPRRSAQRERVAAFTAEGYSPKEIAYKLKLSGGAVLYHMKKLYARHGVTPERGRAKYSHLAAVMKGEPVPVSNYERAVALHREEGLGVREIAGRLDLHLESVRQFLKRAKN